MSSKVDEGSIRKKANRYFGMKMFFNLILIVLGSILIAFFLRDMQHRTAIAKQQASCEDVLSETIDVLGRNAQEAAELTELFHNGMQATVSNLSDLLTSGLYDSMSEMTRRKRVETMRDIQERSGVQYLLVIDETGKVLLSPDANYVNKDLREMNMLSDDNLALLTHGTISTEGIVTPAEEHNETGNYYFYSIPVSFSGMKLSIVMGTDMRALDVQLEPLKNLERILSRCSVSNDGFVFAAEAQSHSFLYFQNGDEQLAGTDAYETGLSENIFTDGYAGMETINGTKYYCVSRSFNGNTYVCAVAAATDVFRGDNFVLIWSIVSFIVIMMLCLIYAYILRQDCVNHNTKTEIVPFIRNKEKKPIILLDRTIGKRVLPLLLVSVLFLFCVSFYTQTMLEISSAITESNIAINEVSARYQESGESRGYITDYYNKWFLSQTKLLSYLLEEDPSVLNEATDLVYTGYDANGNKYTFTDDEGNPLRAVRGSRTLNRMCYDNGLESISIFDSNGRRIATNEEDWYSILSLDPEDPASALRDVLDGKKDHLILEPREDEHGIPTQLIGTSFNYYTTTNENGKTVYVSRFEYEQSLTPEWTGGKITRHRSMLLINMDHEIVAQLLATTDLERIFSTNMLNGGFMVLFDNTDEHRVLYSPIKSSIGKTAAEVGVSEKAFSGKYYGFQKANGIEYFQYYVFSNGYYISTAIPKQMMYTARLPISLITAGVGFVLILFLVATAILTTPDEEMLYRKVTQEFKDITDSAVFQISTAAGKTYTTVRASARWDNTTIPWKQRSPEQKLLAIISFILGAFILFIAVSVVIIRKTGSSDTVVTYIMSGIWDRGLNIFALSACALLLIFTGVFISLAKIPISLVTSVMGARSETVGHLLLSVIKYGGAMTSVFYAFYLLGLDASSLLASAGILSLVVGLGAQSLIKDIIAGIFIVFEGEFRVGDIVTINDFRGTVVDIGLRTTKIANGVGNIKIYSNSEINGVLNMTKQNSVAVCDISIEYGQDIEYVEKVLKRELPLIHENYPIVLDAPELLGISALSASSVDLKIIAHCQEADIYTVNRLLNREVLMIFYRNGINVPFPNVTVSKLEPKEPIVKEHKESDE